MKHAEFLSKVEDQRITAAIKAAEEGSTGAVRVFVSRRGYADPTKAAARHFRALSLHRTEQKNAVLVFVAPRSRTFAIYGDAGIHARCGQEFWEQVRNEMAGELKAGRFTDAILGAVARVGEMLKEHFPVAGRETT